MYCKGEINRQVSPIRLGLGALEQILGLRPGEICEVYGGPGAGHLPRSAKLPSFRSRDGGKVMESELSISIRFGALKDPPLFDANGGVLLFATRPRCMF